MAIATKKYLEAIKIFSDLKGKKPLEVYSKMADKGYDWNSFETRWELETEKEALPIININIKCANALADDALELIADALENYGLTIERRSRPYPSKEKDEKTGKLIESKTHSNAYIQILYPDSMEEGEEILEDIEEHC